MNKHALALSRLGASKGGRARAKALSPERRREVARAAARARWGRTELAGDPLATMFSAQQILQVARDEARGQKAGLRARQAAEKVWLAVTTAADAMVGPTGSTAAVNRAFHRAWGAHGERIAKTVNVALHHGCFYSNPSSCDGEFVKPYVRDVGRLFRMPIRDRKIAQRLVKQGWYPRGRGS